MRRRLAGMAALLAAVSLVAAACGNDGGTTREGSPTGTSGPAFETLEEGVLTVGSCLDYRPFEFRKGGELTGFDVEIVEEIASRLGLRVEWVRADFDTIFTALASGKFDLVAAASTITSERDQVVDFSSPYYASRQSLSVNTGETPDVASTDDLGDGDTVGVQKGTTGKAWAEEHLVPNGVELRTYTNITDAFADLEAGRIVGIINDEPSSIAEVEQRPGLEVVEAIDTGENYGLAMSEDNKPLQEAVNGTLQDMIDDGTYAQIFQKWFPELPLPDEYKPSS